MNALASIRRILLALMALTVLFAVAFVGAWIQEQFDNEKEPVVLGKRRVVKDTQIKEVEKWKTRTIPCVDLEELTPVAPRPGDVVVDAGGDISPIEPSRRREERAIERFNERFAGQVDLGLEALLATMELPAGGRYGWAVAATIPRAAPPDGSARKVSLTAVENKPPAFSLGRRSEWWAGIGGMAIKPQFGDVVIEPAVGIGFIREAFSTKKLNWSARLDLKYGIDSRGGEASLFFATGSESWR